MRDKGVRADRDAGEAWSRGRTLGGEVSLAGYEGAQGPRPRRPTGTCCPDPNRPGPAAGVSPLPHPCPGLNFHKMRG